MKITKKYLQRLIQEETDRLFKEEDDFRRRHTNRNSAGAIIQGPEDRDIPFTTSHRGQIRALWADLIRGKKTGRDKTQARITKLEKSVRYLQKLLRTHKQQPHAADVTTTSKV